MSKCRARKNSKSRNPDRFIVVIFKTLVNQRDQFASGPDAVVSWTRADGKAVNSTYLKNEL